jgi:hypothetical protein
MLSLPEIINNVTRHSELEPDTKFYVIEFLDKCLAGYVTEETFNDFNPNTIRVECIMQNGKII